jgi:hypothetical protein
MPSTIMKKRARKRAESVTLSLTKTSVDIGEVTSGQLLNVLARNRPVAIVVNTLRWFRNAESKPEA